MVGLTEIKTQIFEHILYFIQSLNENEMYHTVISGPPGVGKTELGKILGSIYLGLGILKNETFRIVKRSELVGKYLGHTAAQTSSLLFTILKVSFLRIPNPKYILPKILPSSVLPTPGGPEITV
jgi:stage III sporulation protein SpoIIIAA